MKTVVEVKDLVKRYKELVALDHFQLSIKEGEIFGLLGPNGSGKTTTIHCILGLLSYDKGEIQVFGKKMKSNVYEIKQDIGVVMQNVAVFDELTVYENVDYFCGLYINDKQTRKQYVEEAIAFVGLEHFRKFYPKKLSGGLLRRLNIACGIAHKPKLIILDEPTAGLDVEARNEILDLLREYIAQDEKRTILITSHISTDLESLCDDIYLIHDGKIILHEDTDVILEQYGILKVNEEQYRTLDKTAVIKVQKETYGYACFTNDRRFYQENYPQIVVEQGGIDELILMMTGGYR